MEIWQAVQIINDADDEQRPKPTLADPQAPIPKPSAAVVGTWRNDVLDACIALEQKHKTRINEIRFYSERHQHGARAEIRLANRYHAPMGFISGDYDPYRHKPLTPERLHHDADGNQIEYKLSRHVPPRRPILVSPEFARTLLQCLRDSPIHDEFGLGTHLKNAGMKRDHSENNNNQYIVHKKGAWFLGAVREDIGESIARIFATEPSKGILNLPAYR